MRHLKIPGHDEDNVLNKVFSKQDKTRQGKARQGKARQGKARQGKARQGKARQGKARQDKTGYARIKPLYLALSHLNSLL